MKDVFLRIKFSPTKYPLEIEHQLNILDMLVGPEEEEEIREIVAQHPETPEFQLELAYLYADLDKPLHYINAIDRLLNSYPNNVAIKGAYAQAHYTDFSIQEHRDGFQKLFAPEIECVFGEGSLANPISDREYRILLLSLNNYYSEVGEIEKCHHIFELANHLQQDDLCAIIAFKIRHKELPIGGTPDFEKGEIIEEWVRRSFSKLDDPHIKIAPNNELFYLLLNKQADKLTSEEISQLSAIDKGVNLKHDVLWLLRQGLIRTINNMGDTGQDYFLNALFLIAHFEISELTGELLHFLTGLPEEIMDASIGDFGDLFITPPIRKIALSSLDGFYEMLTFTTKNDDEEDLDEDDEDEDDDDDFDLFDDELTPRNFDNYWYLKSFVLNALTDVAAEDIPQGIKAKNLVQKLWNHYSENDHELLGWTMQAIWASNVHGFDKAIKKVYQENKIDLSVHGSIEELERLKLEPGFKNYDSPEHYSNLSDFYGVFSKIRKRLGHPENIDIEQQIDEAIINHLDDIERGKEYLESLGYGYGYEDFDDDDEFFGEFDALEDDHESMQFAQKPTQRTTRKIGRNDPCPCGSGKKYKKCCLNKK